ncbi:MAG: exodeoxyribonuclease VII large subunit [Candidatus Nanosalina sp.]
MRNSQLLIIAATGLLILSLSSQKQPSRKEIRELDPAQIGEIIQVSGEIKSYTSNTNSAFMNLSDGTDSITVVSFNAENQFSRGENVSVTGRVAMYHGRLEIISEDVSRHLSD